MTQILKFLKRWLPIISAFSAAILAVLSQINEEQILNFNKGLAAEITLMWVNQHKLPIATIAAIAVLANSLITLLCSPIVAREGFIKGLIERMNTELFEGNQHMHRITIFKKIGWWKAIVKNYLALILHIFHAPKKVPLYLPIPKKGNYLGVYSRCGLPYAKSTTMLRVDEDRPDRADGVAGYIASYKIAAEAVDLPDISSILEEDLLKAAKIKNVPKDKRPLLADYMRRGKINLAVLRKMHRRARHFYGSVISKRDGSVWGVLLADSIKEQNPFDNAVKTRFNSFAKTISSALNMEV